VKSPEVRTTSSTPVKAPEEAIAIEAHRGHEGVHKQQQDHSFELRQQEEEAIAKLRLI